MADKTKAPDRPRPARKPERPSPTAEAPTRSAQERGGERRPSLRGAPSDTVGPMGGNGRSLQHLQQAAGNQAMSRLMSPPANGAAHAPTTEAPDDTAQAAGTTVSTVATPPAATKPPGDDNGRVLEKPPTSPVARARATDEALQTKGEAQASEQPEYAQSVGVETTETEAETPETAVTAEETPTTAEEASTTGEAEKATEAEQKEQEAETAVMVDEATAQLEEQAPEAEEQEEPEAEEAAAKEEAEEEEEETPEEDEAAEAAASEAGGEGEMGEAAAKVNEFITGLMQSQTETANLAFQRIEFAPRPEEKVDEPRTAFRAAQGRAASEALAAAFLARNVNHVQNLIMLGMTAPPRIMAVAGEAKGMIDTAVVANIAAVVAKIAAMRERANADSVSAIEKISAGRDKALEAIRTASATALGEVEKAHTDTKTTLDTLESEQISSIESLYQTWDPKYRSVGGEVGDKGKSTARTKANTWLSQRNGESSILDGPIHDNRLEAKADAGKKVAGEYAKGLQEEADKQADNLAGNKPQVLDAIRNAATQGREALDQHLEAMKQSLTQSEESATTQIQTKAESLITATEEGLQTTLSSLDAQEASQVARLSAYGASQKAAIDAQAAEAITSLVAGTAEAVMGFNEALRGFVETAVSTRSPDQQDLQPLLAELQVQADTLALTLQMQLETGIMVSETGIRTGGQTSVARVNELGQGAVEQAQATGDQFATSTSTMVAQAQTGFTQLAEGHQKTVDGAKTQATEGFAQTKEAITTVFKAISDRAKENFKNGREELSKGLEREGLKSLDSDIEKYAQEAADAVQPRWKKVVKWIITIAVIIAAVALTIVTAGGAGPIGVVLIGAAIGGLAGAAIQVGHNLVDGKKWSDGVGKAFVVGAIGGAFGGLGGVLAQGVANVGLKLAIEVGIDVVGGVLGDLAVGNPITVEGILLGAAIGAGIGGGLALGSALKGKIKIRPKPAVDAPTVRPDMSGPAPKPAAPEVTTPRPKSSETPTPPKAAPDAPAPKPAEAPAPKAPEAPAPKPAEAPKPKAPEAAPPPKGAGPELAPASKQKAHHDKPEVEDGIVAKHKTADGHEMKVTKDGQLAKCTVCEPLRLKYADDLAADPKLKKRLDDIEAIADPKVKAKKAADFDAELSQKKAVTDPEVKAKTEADAEVQTKKASEADAKAKAKSETAEPADKSPEGETTLAPDGVKTPPKPGEPGSPEHKAQRWEEYQKRTGGKGWDYDRWSNVYDANMTRAAKAHKAVNAYHEKVGWGKREITVDVDGVPRRLDIADVAAKRGVEHKTGYTSRTEDIRSEMARDAQLVKKGWKIEWVFEGKASQPLQDALTEAGITMKFI